MAGVLLSAATIAWVLFEYRRYLHRAPLLFPFNWRLLLVALGWTIALVPAAYLMISALPKSPKLGALEFAGVLISFGVVSIGVLIALLTRLSGTFAVGWISFLDESSFVLEHEGKIEPIRLRPGCVRVALLPNPNHLQLEIRHGEEMIHLWVSARIRDLKLASKGFVLESPQGPALGYQRGRFMDLVTPFIETER